MESNIKDAKRRKLDELKMEILKENNLTDKILNESFPINSSGSH